MQAWQTLSALFWVAQVTALTSELSIQVMYSHRRASARLLIYSVSDIAIGKFARLNTASVCFASARVMVANEQA